MLHVAVKDALDAGFSGLCAAGDLCCVFADPPGSAQVVEYEALLNQFFANVRALGMCQYDESRLPAGLLDQALATHTSVVIDRRHTDNSYYRPWPFTVAQSDPLRTKLERLGGVAR